MQAAPRSTVGRCEHSAPSAAPTQSASGGTRRRTSLATPDNLCAPRDSGYRCCWYLQRFYRDPRRFRYSCELGAYLRLQRRHFMRRREARNMQKS